MAWIRVISETEAEGELRDAYEAMVEPWGGVDNIMKIHSLNVPSLHAHDHLRQLRLEGR